MRKQSTSQRTVRAALLALAIGGLVAVANPAPRISHAADIALTSAGRLAAQSADAVTRPLRG
ncbi:MAG: hypothetical protein ACTHM8_10415 [Sphingomonas sp.]